MMVIVMLMMMLIVLITSAKRDSRCMVRYGLLLLYCMIVLYDMYVVTVLIGYASGVIVL
jgi:hypothetical protein